MVVEKCATSLDTARHHTACRQQHDDSITDDDNNKHGTTQADHRQTTDRQDGGSGGGRRAILEHLCLRLHLFRIGFTLLPAILQPVETAFIGLIPTADTGPRRSTKTVELRRIRLTLSLNLPHRQVENTSASLLAAGRIRARSDRGIPSTGVESPRILSAPNPAQSLALQDPPAWQFASPTGPPHLSPSCRCYAAWREKRRPAGSQMRGKTHPRSAR